MGFGEPKMPSPEEIEKLEESRHDQDLKFYEGGAKYGYSAKKDGVEFTHIDPTDEQVEDARNEMDTEIRDKMLARLSESEGNLVAAHKNLALIYQGLEQVKDEDVRKRINESLAGLMSCYRNLYLSQAQEREYPINLENLGYELAKKVPDQQ